MNKKTTFSLIAIIIIMSCACTSKQSDIKIEAGYYIFTKSEWFTSDKNGVHPKIEFKSALLHVINSDSLKFIGENTIGEFFWEHNDFNYKIHGNKIILTNGEFKKKLNFEVTADQSLMFETNKDDLLKIYFEPLPAKLTGKFKVYGFIKKESAVDDEVLSIAKNVFNKESFNFISDNNVIIQPQLAQFLTGSTFITDTAFTYIVFDNQIVFSNSTHSVTVPFIFDGAFRLFIDNENFERIDLAVVQG